MVSWPSKLRPPGSTSLKSPISHTATTQSLSSRSYHHLCTLKWTLSSASITHTTLITTMMSTEDLVVHTSAVAGNMHTSTKQESGYPSVMATKACRTNSSNNTRILRCKNWETSCLCIRIHLPTRLERRSSMHRRKPGTSQHWRTPKLSRDTTRRKTRKRQSRGRKSLTR